MLYARLVLDRKKESQFLPQLLYEFSERYARRKYTFRARPDGTFIFLEKRRNYYTHTQRSTHRNASRKSRSCIWNYMTRVSRNAVTRDKSTVATIRASSSTAVASKLVLRYEINLEKPRERVMIRACLSRFSVFPQLKISKLPLCLFVFKSPRLYDFSTCSLFDVLISA